MTPPDARWRERAEQVVGMLLVHLWIEQKPRPEKPAVDALIGQVVAAFAKVAQEAEDAAEKFCPEGHSIHAPGPTRDMECPTCRAVREDRERWATKIDDEYAQGAPDPACKRWAWHIAAAIRSDTRPQ